MSPPDFAPGLSRIQARLEREAELAARADSGEPSEGELLVAMAFIMLALGGFVALAVLTVKLLRECAVLP